MRRVLPAVLLSLCVTMLVGASFASTTLLTPARVVIVLSPHLTWDDIEVSETPSLYDLASEGAVGNLNVRNRNLNALSPEPVEQGALTFSAGAWAALDEVSPSAYSINERYDAGTAGEAYARLTGTHVADDEVVYLGMPRIQRLSAEAGTLDVRPGTLGGEIVAAGGVTTAIGNSDSGRGVTAPRHERPAAVVAMDYEGGVAYGNVSSALLRDDIREPFGVATDLDKFSTALDSVEEALSSRSGPQLIVLDPGDLSRAAAVEGVTTPQLASRQHADAVRTLDRVVARARETLPPHSVLMVLTPVETEASEAVVGLAPAIVYGPGFSGELTSSSTQRPGLVTNLDVAATVLGLLGIERPVQVLGNYMSADGADTPLEERIARLTQADLTATSVDSSRAAVLNGFIGVTMLVLLASTFLLVRANRWQPGHVARMTEVARVALLGVLAVPPASLLMFVVDGEPTSSAEAVFALFAITAVVWALLLVARRYTALRVPIAIASLATTALILIDQLLGAPWSFTSFLGYSPLMAARYYGIGNEGAAILFGSSLVGVAFLLDALPDSVGVRTARRWGLPLLGLFVVATCAAPFLGANVGVAAWGVVGYAIAWALINGYRVSWKLLAAIVVIVIVIVAVFSFVDLSGGESQTHLGRAWTSADQGGLGELWLIVQRKAETNLRVLTHTNWSFILIGVLGFLGLMRWHPRGDFADTLRDNPHFSGAMAASLWGGLAAYFTEDSGIVIPALIMLYVGAGILYLMCARLRDRLPAEEGGAA